jgi:hypothetical protein
MWQLATGVRDHFEPAYVAGLISQGLGPFLLDKAPEHGDDLDTSLGKIAGDAVRADHLFQSRPVEWEFLFADPGTGSRSGSRSTRRSAWLTLNSWYTDMLGQRQKSITQSSTERRDPTHPLANRGMHNPPHRHADSDFCPGGWGRR